MRRLDSGWVLAAVAGGAAVHAGHVVYARWRDAKLQPSEDVREILLYLDPDAPRGLRRRLHRVLDAMPLPSLSRATSRSRSMKLLPRSESVASLSRSPSDLRSVVTMATHDSDVFFCVVTQQPEQDYGPFPPPISTSTHSLPVPAAGRLMPVPITSAATHAESMPRLARDGSDDEDSLAMLSGGASGFFSDFEDDEDEEDDGDDASQLLGFPGESDQSSAAMSDFTRATRVVAIQRNLSDSETTTSASSDSSGAADDDGFDDESLASTMDHASGGVSVQSSDDVCSGRSSTEDVIAESDVAGARSSSLPHLLLGTSAAATSSESILAAIAVLNATPRRVSAAFPTAGVAIPRSNASSTSSLSQQRRPAAADEGDCVDHGGGGSNSSIPCVASATPNAQTAVADNTDADGPQHESADLIDQMNRSVSDASQRTAVGVNPADPADKHVAASSSSASSISGDERSQDEIQSSGAGADTERESASPHAEDLADKDNAAPAQYHHYQQQQQQQRPPVQQEQMQQQAAAASASSRALTMDAATLAHHASQTGVGEEARMHRATVDADVLRRRDSNASSLASGTLKGRHTLLEGVRRGSTQSLNSSMTRIISSARASRALITTSASTASLRGFPSSAHIGGVPDTDVVEDDELWAAITIQRFVRAWLIRRRWLDLVHRYQESDEAVPSRNRFMVLNEIMHTETTYVENLKTLIGVFLVPMRKAMAQGKSGALRSDQIATIFSTIEMVATINSLLLDKLMERNAQHPWMTDIGMVFVEMAPMLKLYQDYVSNYDAASKTLHQCRTKVPSFNSFCEKCKSSPICHGQDIASFLIMPIQRIPRYVLLLKELLHLTPPQHCDYQQLHLALDTMKEVASHVNANTVETSAIARLLDVQARIASDSLELLVPGRRVVSELEVSDAASGAKTILFLLSDVLLVCRKLRKKKGERAWNMLHHWPLETVEVSDAAVASPALEPQLHLVVSGVTYKYTVQDAEKAAEFATGLAQAKAPESHNPEIQALLVPKPEPGRKMRGPRRRGKRRGGQHARAAASSRPDVRPSAVVPRHD